MSANKTKRSLAHVSFSTPTSESSSNKKSKTTTQDLQKSLACVRCGQTYKNSFYMVCSKTLSIVCGRCTVKYFQEADYDEKAFEFGVCCCSPDDNDNHKIERFIELPVQVVKMYELCEISDPSNMIRCNCGGQKHPHFPIPLTIEQTIKHFKTVKHLVACPVCNKRDLTKSLAEQHRKLHAMEETMDLLRQSVNDAVEFPLRIIKMQELIGVKITPVALNDSTKVNATIDNDDEVEEIRQFQNPVQDTQDIYPLTQYPQSIE